MARRFSKCPTWWVRNDDLGLKKFSGGKNAGTSISALKCILGISVSIDFWTRKAKLSVSDLEALTGLSRPMVIRGLKELVELGIVVVDKTAHVHEYELTVFKHDDGLGLERGIEGSKATHQTIQQHYTAIQKGMKTHASISTKALEPRVLSKGLFTKVVETPEQVAERLADSVNKGFADRGCKPEPQKFPSP